jgi:predicted ribosome quality control (RQC) complex YloA/Tae2 family protein
MVLFLVYEFEGISYNIKVGKNSKQNWQIIEEASPNDIWFHLADDRPSCHIILQVPGEIVVPRQVIKHCCVLCKANTNKFKSEKNVPVIYSKVEHISLGEKEGQVYTQPSHTKQIVI